jgi:hypothetical protein
VTGLPEKIVAVHEALRDASLPHAFGGALALAWCTGRARGTIDIDINVFVDADAGGDVIHRLPPQVRYSRKDLEDARREGQVRLWWDKTPVDLFLNTTEFHRQAAERTRWERFMGRDVPFLSCSDLAVFKAFFNRTKDWADLEEMQAAGTLDVAGVSAILIHYLGADDVRIAKLAALNAAPPA